MSMNIFLYAQGNVKKDTINKEFFSHHYQPFEKYIFKKRRDVNIIKHFGNDIVAEIAKIDGYDDFAVQCIPLSYSLFNRKGNDLSQILRSIGSDEYLHHVNILFEKCREKPGDLNWIVRVTYEEGKRLEQEKIKETGQAASAQEKDTFVAIGLLLRYMIKNKLVS